MLKNIVSNLKNDINERKNFVKLTRETYLHSNNLDYVKLTIFSFEELLDEFEFTITQSMQAIKSLESELYNLEEIQKSEPKIEQNNNIPREYEIEKNYFDLQSDRNIIINQMQNSTNSNFGINLNFDYSNLKDYSELINEIKESHEYDTKEHIERMKQIDIKQKSGLAREYNMQFTFSQKGAEPVIEEESDRQEFIVRSSKPLSPMFESIRENTNENTHQAHTIKPVAQNQIQIQDNKYNTMSYNNSTNYNFNDLEEPESESLRRQSIILEKEREEEQSSPRQGLRQKIKNITHGGNNKIQRNLESEYLETETEEHNIPIIKSKQNAFSNFKNKPETEMEQEIIITNIIKRVNRLENSKLFLKQKYGSYEIFLFKLKNFDIDLEEVENDLNNLSNSNLHSNVNYQNNNTTQHNLTSQQSSKNLHSNHNNTLSSSKDKSSPNKLPRPSSSNSFPK